MKLPEFNEKGERMVLGHDPVLPYPLIFWICFLGGSAYLALILVSALGASGGGH
jgi:hypothetical protein